MPGLTCNACNMEFENEAERKLHYSSDWHRYNLKRKVIYFCRFIICSSENSIPMVLLKIKMKASEQKKSKLYHFFYRNGFTLSLFLMLRFWIRLGSWSSRGYGRVV